MIAASRLLRYSCYFCGVLRYSCVGAALLQLYCCAAHVVVAVWQLLCYCHVALPLPLVSILVVTRASQAKRAHCAKMNAPLPLRCSVAGALQQHYCCPAALGLLYYSYVAVAMQQCWCCVAGPRPLYSHRVAVTNSLTQMILKAT